MNLNTMRVMKMKPEEMLVRKQNVSYSYLKVFGYKAFAHVPKEQRLKLDDKAIPCIFIGYGDDEFGYKLWDLERKKIIRSRDMVFYAHEIATDLRSANPEVVEDVLLGLHHITKGSFKYTA
ncbi:hypothetical protein RJ639_017255 [Escallonia herrerae]|uniref:Retroviral polymerase SH3-like domain-containing protein n=1 Tax=Escallonia herrerae TaxID=1293975 RepID=A0AA88VB65_9ASTE|nr:hypothetical protein RJ639_017255 [Escallonia herrerae]